jgi:uncharacterized membrane protein YkvA (DUF1232 family)
VAARLIARAKEWARLLKRDVVAVWLAARDSRTPTTAKVVAAIVAAYALSPIDLIPDVVPVLGYLDDLLIVPFGIWLAIRLIPPPLMAEFRASAVREGAQPVSRAGMLAVISIWIACGAALLWVLTARTS